MSGRLRENRATAPELSWDSDELVTLTVDHIQSVLERYVGGELSAAEVEHWADLIECRDDISYDETIKELISELANPVLSGRLNVLKAQSLLVRLRKLQQSKSR